MIGYIPVAGTWAKNDDWVLNNYGPFTQFMSQNGLHPVRKVDGTPWDWSTKLTGLWWQSKKVWVDASVDLATFLNTIPFPDRNVIAHSHGGQVSILTAASGVKIRTLTTIGTPVRSDIPANEAVKNIDFWQHIYDAKWDIMGTLKRYSLGKIGDGSISFNRWFKIPGVTNISIKDISHSTILRDPLQFHIWLDYGIIISIKQGSDVPISSKGV
jgi:hypothetical protein